MNEGMLWLDDHKERTIEDKVSRAVDWYKEHYGPKPTICFVNKAELEEELYFGEISVRPATFIRPNHFWIGTGAPV
jgi:hypothetical protein